MRRATVSLVLVVGVCLSAGDDPAWAGKSRTPITSKVKTLQMSPRELRIRVRALIRPTLGTVEEAADRFLGDTPGSAAGREILRWEIETTNTLLSAMLRNDPVLALADAWGYAFQVEDLLARPEAAATFGTFAPRATAAMAQVRAVFRDFAENIQAGVFVESFEASVRQWATLNPIEGALYRRPSMDSVVADAMAASTGGGALAALGSLEETTSDIIMRLDLYTIYLPRLARWEAELAVDDLARGVDLQRLTADIERLTRAVDRITAVAEATPELISRERVAALEAVRAERSAATRDLQGERRVILDAVRQERIETLKEIEAIAQRLLDRSSATLGAAVNKDLEDLVRSVEEARKRLIGDSSVMLNGVVDHAFVRAVQLLLIAAALGAAGLVLYARFLRRS